MIVTPALLLKRAPRSVERDGAWSWFPGENDSAFNRTITAPLNHRHIWMRPVKHQWRCMHRNMTVTKPWMN